MNSKLALATARIVIFIGAGVALGLSAPVHADVAPAPVVTETVSPAPVVSETVAPETASPAPVVSPSAVPTVPASPAPATPASPALETVDPASYLDADEGEDIPDAVSIDEDNGTYVLYPELLPACDDEDGTAYSDGVAVDACYWDSHGKGRNFITLAR